MKTNFLIPTLSIFLFFLLSACTPDPNDEFIQGTWEIAHTDAGNEFFQWQFNNGTFTREQEIDRTTSLYTTGSYRVVESEGDVLTIELFDYSGDRIAYENNPMTIKIEIDRANDSARITNVLFIRGGL
jgi:hypothetical protein